MASAFNICLSFVLGAEGGWSDNPKDHGGCTMQGVTLASYRAWKHDQTLTCAQLKTIPAKEVGDFYYENFWLRVHGEQLPLGVDLMVMDAAVNMGVSNSVKLLQQEVQVKDDGIMGPKTLAACLKMKPFALINSLALAQTIYYLGLDDFSTFGSGWINRLNARHSRALAIINVA